MRRCGSTPTEFALCLLAATALLLAGCASRPADEEVAIGPEQADKLYVVDCLLPAQVRKLGEHFTYLAARQPIRTTAIDCEIRGGEYVAYDRANYATALKVWLPKAKEGDPQAQTYVGEIFEKGLGIQPDYEAAAHWYRQAAEKGYAPAMINLGFLYEKGLGVPQDPVAALNWYRKASGLDKTDLAFAASVEVYNRRMEELRQEAAQYRQEAAGLKEQLERLKQQHQKTLASLARTRAEAEASRRQVQRLRQQLKAQPVPESGELRQRLEQKLAELKEKEQAVARLEQELAAQSQQLTALKQGSGQAVQEKEAKIARLEQELAKRDRDLEALRQKLAQTQGEADKLRQQVASGSRELQARLTELEGLRQQLAAKQAQGENPPELARLAAELAAKQAAIEALQTELSQRQQRLSELEGRLSHTEKLVQSQEAKLQDLQAQIAAKEQSLETLRRQLTEANARLAAQSQAVQALRQELAKKQSDRTASQAELALLAAQLKEKQAELERQQAHIQSLQTALAEREKSAKEPALQVARAEAVSGEGPRIEIIDPPLRPQRGSLMVVTRGLVEARTVIGKIHAPAGILAFLVNDQDFIPEPDGTFKLKIPLKGKETPVHLAAIDKNSRRTELEFVIFQDLKAAAPVPKPEQSETNEEGKTLAAMLPREIFGGYYALIIGNNAYRHLPALDTPHNDAKALAKVLAERYGFKTQVLLDATRYDILKALNEYRKTLTEKDNFLLYYAGHGTLEKVTERGFWLPVDAELENTANWISNQDITDLLRIMAAAHVMVIADSCYSGSLTRNSVARLEGGMTPEKRAEWIKLMLKAKSRMALTSGGLNPVLDSGGGGHSVFAKALIQALEKNQGILESFRLYTEVSALVADAARSEDFHQVPEFSPIRHAGHEAGEFFFVPAGAGMRAGL